MTIVKTGPLLGKAGEYIRLGLPRWGNGTGFPIHPQIDREGIVHSSFQQPLQKNIVRLYHSVVEHSDEALGKENWSWLDDLRMLLSECVSLVDIVLHHMYFEAKYNGGQHGWTFCESRLNKHPAMRLGDKLRWVGQITGTPLDNAAMERSALFRIKSVRNHFNHFDPPCVAYTLEDVVEWLHDVRSVGKLLWKIRQKARAQLNQGIIEIVMLPTVRLCPLDPGERRLPQPTDVGYRSSQWP